jgi:putative acetyltransferase
MPEAPIGPQSPIIVRESPASPDSEALIGELTVELAGNDYPEQSTHGYSVQQLVDRGVAFYVCRVAGQAVGCGGVEIVDAAAAGGEPFAELKRMYVRPAHRGRGLAHALLAALIDHAVAAGVDLARLETGARQHSAVAFYRRAGFTVTDPFPPYRPDHESVYMERRLGR